MKKLLYLILIVFMGSESLLAQEKDGLSSISVENIQNGQSWSWNILKGGKATVFVFTSTDCPFDVKYNVRIKNLSKEFSSAEFIMVNSNSQTIDEMKAWIGDHNVKMTYLVDRDQKIKEFFQVTKSPEVVVLKGNDESNIVYKGAIDDNPQVEEDISKNYLKEAIEAALNGQVVSDEYVRPMGCVIR